MKELNIGLIGCGFMGNTHTYALKNLPMYYAELPFRVNLHTVCARNEENLKRFASLHGFRHTTTDPDSLINNPEIDIVDISSPNIHHFDFLCKAIRAGKHIYCEKPVVVSSGEAAGVRQALAGAPKGRIHRVVFNNRFFPAVLRAGQLFAEGRIGRLLSFRSAYRHSSSINPCKPVGWKQDRSVCGGGVLFDLGSHAIDLIDCITGGADRITEVCGKAQIAFPERLGMDGKPWKTNADEAFYLLARTAGGAVGTIEASKVAIGTNDDFTVELFGEKGALRFNLMEPNWLYFYDGAKPGAPLGGECGFTKIECVGRYEFPGGVFPGVKAPIGWERGHVHSMFTFLSSVCDGKQTAPSLYDGLYVSDVMHAAYRSDESGKWETV